MELTSYTCEMDKNEFLTFNLCELMLLLLLMVILKDKILYDKKKKKKF
jgi:hypothetical protein